jgi:hypothetical protein
MRAEPTNASATSSLIVQANAACARLERILARLNKAEHASPKDDLVALRRRIANLASEIA